MIKISFRTKKLEKAYRHLQEGAKLWGIEVARKYIIRVNALQALDNTKLAAQVFPEYRPHELKGTRKGTWALDLHDRWRLLYKPSDTGIELSIEEVSNHYDD